MKRALEPRGLPTPGLDSKGCQCPQQVEATLAHLVDHCGIWAPVQINVHMDTQEPEGLHQRGQCHSCTFTLIIAQSETDGKLKKSRLFMLCALTFWGP